MSARKAVDKTKLVKIGPVTMGRKTFLSGLGIILIGAYMILSFSCEFKKGPLSCSSKPADVKYYHGKEK